MHKFWKLEKAWACAPDESHAPALLNLLSDAELMQYSDNGAFSLADAQDICSGRYPWFLIYSPENAIIGAAALLRPNGESAEICLLLKKEWRGKDIGREVLARLCAVAYGTMHLKRLYARVLKDNQNAQRFFEKCGFEPIDSLPLHLKVPDEAPSVYYDCTLSLPSLSLSVIIPVHNCARWIEECIGSLEGIPCEIIVCDDNSDDRTLDIVIALAEKDKRIRLLPLDGRNYAGGARNAALKEARGEYIFFLDGDDRLCDRNVCRRMFMAALFSRADMICSSEVEFFDEEKSWRLLRGSQYKGMIGQEKRAMMFCCQLPVWMCWFRRDYIERCALRFAEGVQSYEDNLFSFVAAASAQSMTTVPGPLVSHRIRRDSLSHISDANVQTAFFEVARQQLAYAKANGLCERLPEVMRDCFFHSVFLTAVHVWHMLGEEHDWIIGQAVTFLRKAFPDMREHIAVLKASDAQKAEFALAWDNTTQYLLSYRKEAQP